MSNLENGVPAGNLPIGTSFKRSGGNSMAYTLIRVDPEDPEVDRDAWEGCILALCFQTCGFVYDIKVDDVVYRINDGNRTDW